MESIELFYPQCSSTIFCGSTIQCVTYPEYVVDQEYSKEIGQMVNRCNTTREIMRLALVKLAFYQMIGQVRRADNHTILCNPLEHIFYSRFAKDIRKLYTEWTESSLGR